MTLFQGYVADLSSLIVHIPDEGGTSNRYRQLEIMIGNISELQKARRIPLGTFFLFGEEGCTRDYGFYFPIDLVEKLYPNKEVRTTLGNLMGLYPFSLDLSAAWPKDLSQLIPSAQEAAAEFCFESVVEHSPERFYIPHQMDSVLQFKYMELVHSKLAEKKIV